MKKIAAIILISFALLSCSESITFVDVAESPTLLINDIASYQSVGAVKSLLAKQNLKFTVLEDQKSPPGNSRPPFNIFAVRINGYAHLSHSGRLELIFFNNRLMSAFFYPDDLKAYLGSLKEIKGIDLVSKGEARYSTFTKIWKYKDFEGLYYVGWEDTRLAQEQRIWIRRYS